MCVHISFVNPDKLLSSLYSNLFMQLNEENNSLYHSDLIFYSRGIVVMGGSGSGEGEREISFCSFTYQVS